MKDMVIVSIYDSGFRLSIMVDGEIHKSIYMNGKWYNDVLADRIQYAYYTEEDFCEWLKNKYKDKTIIICEDGSIKIIQKKDGK